MRLKNKTFAAILKFMLQFNLIESSILGVFGFCFLVQMYYTFFVYAKLATVRIHPVSKISTQPLSVIICTRNELINLSKYLSSILQQDYPTFEVVVVNDRSWDGTDELLDAFTKKYANLKVVTIKEGGKFMAGKKFAVTMGIKAAQFEWLVFTDADCKPASNQWLRGMRMPENKNHQILLGYSPYFKKRGLLNALIRFETFYTAVNYLSFALKGNPYMGVGRNMAYKKSLFLKNKGFAAHMHVPSGDDDLFVNANANMGNTAIQIHPDTHVWSEPKTTWLNYLKQKKRHAGAGKLYKLKHKAELSFQTVTQLLFYVLLFTLCFFETTLYVSFGALLLSIIFRSFVYIGLLKRLNCRELAWWFPLLDIILFVFLAFNAILIFFIKKVDWK